MEEVTAVIDNIEDLDTACADPCLDVALDAYVNYTYCDDAVNSSSLFYFIYDGIDFCAMDGGEYCTERLSSSPYYFTTTAAMTCDMLNEFAEFWGCCYETFVYLYPQIATEIYSDLTWNSYQEFKEVNEQYYTSH